MATWCKLKNGDWGIKGENLIPGKTADVVAKSGKVRTVTVKKVIFKSQDGVSIATIEAQEEQ